MGIQVEFNPDLALRVYGTPDREESECLPQNLIEGEIYNFLKKEQRIFWLTDNKYWNQGEMPLVMTKGNQQLSRPIASIKIIEVTHFLLKGEPYTKGKYQIIEVFNQEDNEIKFESYKRINKNKMKIFVVCSKHFYNRIPEIQNQLEQQGHEIMLPNSFKEPFKEEEMKKLSKEEHQQWKAEMLRREEENIKPNDAILVLNLEKSGQPNYIGGATFMEIAKAWELEKQIFFYNPLPKGIFTDELTAINPIILNGDLSLIK